MSQLLTLARLLVIEKLQIKVVWHISCLYCVKNNEHSQVRWVSHLLNWWFFFNLSQLWQVFVSARLHLGGTIPQYACNPMKSYRNWINIKFSFTPCYLVKWLSSTFDLSPSDDLGILGSDGVNELDGGISFTCVQGAGSVSDVIVANPAASWS